jgi:hypothetical protein
VGGFEEKEKVIRNLSREPTTDTHTYCKAEFNLSVLVKTRRVSNWI